MKRRSEPRHLATFFDRYRPIIDDYDAFIDACARPLARIVWANPLRADLGRAAEVVAKRAPEAEPLRWRENAWRLPAESRPGNWPEYRLGWFHIQEEATLWPGALLHPRPGSRVLDLCAAPGNKTALLALEMDDRGTLVANEKRWDRLPALRFNLDRLGVTSAVVTCADGLHFPGEDGTYDGVLVDVPCSCEGTARKSRPRSVEAAARFRTSVQAVQIGLLRRALHLCKVGGEVVYATCTFAPEENERVLHSVWESKAEIVPLEPPSGMTLSPGIAEWNGERFRPDVVNAARYWPHHNDTGGFFVARLRKTAP